ncbi:MAG: hypothetical protein VKL60_00405 [Sphaerospermopsis sp.]|nr:hypothetical protein [Sphaerospermopsis sp.]
MKTKTKYLNIRLSEEELNKLKENASCYQNISQYIIERCVNTEQQEIMDAIKATLKYPYTRMVLRTIDYDHYRGVAVYYGDGKRVVYEEVFTNFKPEVAADYINKEMERT